MRLTVATSPGSGELPRLAYSWDGSTGILGARLSLPIGRAGQPEGANGIVEVSGPDGSWLHFEVADGRLRALEIAVWPEMAPHRTIPIPAAPEGFAEVVFHPRSPRVSRGGVMGVSLPVRAIPDCRARTLQLCFGSARQATAVRAADRLYVGTDYAGRLASVWLLGVPGIPGGE